MESQADFSSICPMFSTARYTYLIFCACERSFTFLLLALIYSYIRHSDGAVAHTD